MVKNLSAMRETQVQFRGQENPLEKGMATHSSILGFPCGSAGKESACNVGDLDLISGLGRSPGKRKGYPLHYSGLENSMNCIVHGVSKSWTRLSYFPEKAMAPHSSTLAQRILWIEEPGRLKSMRSLRG